MVQWNLCCLCQKVVDEFEKQCGWCFPKMKVVKSDERQLLLFDLKPNFDTKDYFNSECTHKVYESN